MLFDSHCHLTAEHFTSDRPDVLRRARSAGVGGIVTVASTPSDTLEGMSLNRSHPWIRSTAGFHPHEAKSADHAGMDRVRELCGNAAVVAVGECGLDYHYDNAPRDVQRRVFDAHIELASESGLPLVVHSRSADEDMIEALRAAPRGVMGVLHCFTGSDDLLDTALELGFHVSFTGLVTFKNFGGRDQVRRVPTGALMVETDAPYLAPVPHRGKRNEPAYVGLVAQAIAMLRDESPADVARHTTDTALAFYSIDRTTLATSRTAARADRPPLHRSTAEAPPSHDRADGTDTAEPGSGS